jgi:hypothetical protein
MGNSASSSASSTATYSDKHVFEKELQLINNIVANIVTEKNVFRNNDYNFLSQDVCNKHYLLLESELNKHLKIQLKGVGESLLIIPKERESKVLPAKNMNKEEICKKISQHYMKILYILCLIKYVYNLEHHGDYSISGIIMRNIKVVNDIIEINFCNVPQKDYSKDLKDAVKLDFSQLEGLKFLTQFFLDQGEATAFTKVLRGILARGSKGVIQRQLCNYKHDSKARVEHFKELEKIYQDRFKEKLVCGVKENDTPDLMAANKQKFPNLFMYVERDNPVFAKEYCYEIHKLVIQTNTAEGKKVLEQYNTMKKNYKQNLDNLGKLLNLVITPDEKLGYVLKDIDKELLDGIIVNVKDTIKTYYIQSLMDYHELLDIGKKTPNINMLK